MSEEGELSDSLESCHGRHPRKLWLIASEDVGVLGKGTAQIFLEADGGSLAFGPTDLFLQREAAGCFELLGAAPWASHADELETTASSIAKSLILAGSDPTLKSRVFDVLAVTITPVHALAEAQARSHAARHRSPLERRLRQLAGRFEAKDASTITSMIGKIVEGRHEECGWAELPNSDRTRGCFGFDVQRLCGFAIASDEAASGYADEGLHSLRLSTIGHVPLRDDLLIEILRGMRSSHRRILASVATHGDRVSVRAGVFDEFHALLHLEAPGEVHDDVEALLIDADSIVFDGKPWTLFPAGPALFEGTLTPASIHEITIRAALTACHDLRLQCALAADASSSLFFV